VLAGCVVLTHFCVILLTVVCFAHQAEPDRKQVAPGFGYKLAHQASLLYASPQTGGANWAGLVPAFFVIFFRLHKKILSEFPESIFMLFLFL
jgi:hypothetical protein